MATIVELQDKLKVLEQEKKVLQLELEIERLKKEIEQLRCQHYWYPWGCTQTTDTVPQVTWTVYTESNSIPATGIQI